MITLQHASLYFLSLCDKGEERKMFRGVPWLLLPDAIRAYTGSRQPSHFEKNPFATDTSWMEFPAASLSILTKANALELVNYHMADGYLPCVIGEETKLDVFDKHNWDHPGFHELRIHLIQDRILDAALRSLMVNVEGRFEDRFVVRHNHSIVLDGKQLRNQVKVFEELGFLYLVGKIHKRTVILLDQEWFEKNVYHALLNSAYPQDLADTTYWHMHIPGYIAARIAVHDFELTDEDKSRVVITDDLTDVLNQMYAAETVCTYREL